MSLCAGSSAKASAIGIILFLAATCTRSRGRPSFARRRACLHCMRSSLLSLLKFSAGARLTFVSSTFPPARHGEKSQTLQRHRCAKTPRIKARPDETAAMQLDDGRHGDEPPPERAAIWFCHLTKPCFEKSDGAHPVAFFTPHAATLAKNSATPDGVRKAPPTKTPSARLTSRRWRVQKGRGLPRQPETIQFNRQRT